MLTRASESLPDPQSLLFLYLPASVPYDLLLDSLLCQQNVNAPKSKSTLLNNHPENLVCATICAEHWKYQGDQDTVPALWSSHIARETGM